MAFEVEYTDEFEQWWDGLTAAEQNSISSSVGLLEERGPTWIHRIAQRSLARGMGTCANSGSSTRDIRIVCCMPSIPTALRFCSSAETKQVMIDGMHG